MLPVTIAMGFSNTVSTSFPFTARSWLTSFARSSVLAVLKDAVTKGYFIINEDDEEYCFGPQSGISHTVRIRVTNDHFWTRVLVSGDIGFGEAYMLGEVQVDDVYGVIGLFIDNLDGVMRISSMYSRVAATLTGLSNGLLGQTLSKARLNVIAHYDLSNELFKAFLSKEMMYSCALWGDDEGGINGDLASNFQLTNDGLEAAQQRKLRHICRQARLKPGQRVLEFGTGWGGLAIFAASNYGVEVDTLTLSIEQKTLAEERIREAGLEHRIRVHLLDYRKIPSEFKHAFDAFISIEMIEHVGTKYYNTYFKIVDSALKPKNAVAVVSSSTFPECRYSEYQGEDFGRRYFWPGANLPSATALITAAHAASQGRFTLYSVDSHTAHYPRTFRAWDRRFKANITQEVAAKEFPALRDDAEFTTFMRKWEYYFPYIGVAFEKGYINCHMLTLVRGDDAPVA